MKILVKDFTVKPVMCPANFTDCSPCRYAKLTEVHNCAISASKPDFGYVECSYIDWFKLELKKAQEED